MTHDLRQALGYRRLPASDPQEQELRDEWYLAKKQWEDASCPDSGIVCQHFQYVDRKLADFLWKRASDERDHDRQKHPKAKRNLPVERPIPGAISTRVLP